MSVKVVAVVLVVVVVLFVAGLAVGGSQGDGGADSGKGGLVGFVGDRVGGTAEVAPENLHPGCPVGAAGQLLFDGSCAVAVDRADDRLRTVRITPRQKVHITTVAPENDDLRLEGNLDPQKETVVAIGSKGGSFTLDCEAGFGNPCRVDVARGGD